MSVSLRLSRGGSKKRPFFRIVAADIRAPRDGRYIERLGTYNPMREQSDPERVSLNLERIKYWLSVGAKPTDRVLGFLAKQGLLKKPTTPKQTKQDKPKKKTIEKLKGTDPSMVDNINKLKNQILYRSMNRFYIYLYFLLMLFSSNRYLSQNNQLKPEIERALIIRIINKVNSLNSSINSHRIRRMKCIWTSWRA